MIQQSSSLPKDLIQQLRAQPHLIPAITNFLRDRVADTDASMAAQPPPAYSQSEGVHLTGAHEGNGSIHDPGCMHARARPHNHAAENQAEGQQSPQFPFIRININTSIRVQGNANMIAMNRGSGHGPAATSGISMGTSFAAHGPTAASINAAQQTQADAASRLSATVLAALNRVGALQSQGTNQHVGLEINVDSGLVLGGARNALQVGPGPNAFMPVLKRKKAVTGGVSAGANVHAPGHANAHASHMNAHAGHANAQAPVQTCVPAESRGVKRTREQSDTPQSLQSLTSNNGTADDDSKPAKYTRTS